ncbi:hypothetical protein [Carnobacterium maltaromaticum]|uniref:hypothetical protein n=1 Tax=Carnobacterium maltaromaticum TaxID=2751 RepID=UPI000E7227BB|nr:hypothetical protein [Carnobacterium maltaromaticum]AOA04142.1 hypothetical protein BFC23_16630 [Carnobacterium maltaromaticum]
MGLFLFCSILVVCILFAALVCVFCFETFFVEKVKKSREQSIAKKLEIECEDFAVFTLVNRDRYLGDIDGFSAAINESVRKYYSGDNAVWLIGTENTNYEVLFKGKTAHIIYIKKVENMD